MATIKHSSSQKINRLINYCEKRAEVTSSHLLVAEDRKSVQQQMKLTRELFNKTGGVEGHHFIQSFKPGEVTPEQANELGLELAKKMHPNREAIIYTHTDKDHIHNHIVLNSPDIEQGKKLSVTRKHYYDWQRANDSLCRGRGLSIVEEKQKKERVTLPEYHIMAKGKMPYKEHLRQALDRAKEIATSLQELKTYVKEKFSIDSKLQKGKVYFKTPEMERFISGNRLGNNYKKEVLEHELERNAKEYERGVRQLREERKPPTILPDPNQNGASESRRSEKDISRYEQFTEYALGQKRSTQSSTRGFDERNDKEGGETREHRVEGNEHSVRYVQGFSKSAEQGRGEQQRASQEREIPYIQSLSEERRGNDKSVRSDYGAQTNSRAGKEDGNEGKTSAVRSGRGIERDRVSPSELSLDGTNKVKPKVKKRNRDMDIER
ncbi:relaxase/mobilization nuclease domain-containing protein [Priestia endophytica]|uniref:relaxase/mobilization nuclease domain-containing protein n=1 Tax=Priestia endophytica TaxID=135735 RepID=UPI00124DE49D|nr:relaxase/mobilization nuclease domain-containing protein [Priestia endophytica]KAB2486520.1 relaxase/mobilization nuclease domain-containing protein [Priestia endophytica]